MIWIASRHIYIHKEHYFVLVIYAAEHLRTSYHRTDNPEEILVQDI